MKNEHGYGFNLHSDKTKRGQFIRSVDPGSPAESADIRAGDRLVEVAEEIIQNFVDKFYLVKFLLVYRVVDGKTTKNIHRMGYLYWGLKSSDPILHK